jgi:hypothetical protein
VVLRDLMKTIKETTLQMLNSKNKPAEHRQQEREAKYEQQPDEEEPTDADNDTRQFEKLELKDEEQQEQSQEEEEKEVEKEAVKELVEEETAEEEAVEEETAEEEAVEEAVVEEEAVAEEAAVTEEAVEEELVAEKQEVVEEESVEAQVQEKAQASEQMFAQSTSLFGADMLQSNEEIQEKSGKGDAPFAETEVTTETTQTLSNELSLGATETNYQKEKYQLTPKKNLFQDEDLVETSKKEIPKTKGASLFDDPLQESSFIIPDSGLQNFLDNL